MFKRLVSLSRLIVNHSNDREYLEWYLKHKKKLLPFRHRHLNEKCFIIGNGPSLNRMDLSPLKNCTCFGLNKIYLLLENADFDIDYHVAVNQLVIEQSAPEFTKLNCPSFLSYRAHKETDVEGSNFIYLMTAGTPFIFSTDILDSIFEGYTVTYVALQIAFYMGFSEVYLIGVDHHFITQGDPNEKQFLEGPDPNHFHPDYFSGNEWHLPDLDGSELAYRLAKYYFEIAGRKIFDATVDGKLEVFPKVSFEEAVARCKRP